jgi:hypothetical protein
LQETLQRHHAAFEWWQRARTAAPFGFAVLRRSDALRHQNAGLMYIINDDELRERARVLIRALRNDRICDGDTLVICPLQ